MQWLDPIDALMLTAELVSSPMHVAALLVMTPPEGEDPRSYVDGLFEQSLTAASRIDPRLRRRPYRGVDTGMMWVWRDVPDVDIRHHVQRRSLPPGSGTEALWRLVSDLHALRLDHSAPLWMAYLIDGLPDGRFAFYIKVHHIVIDGVAGLEMIARSLTTDPGRRGMPPFYAGDHDPAPRPPKPRALVAALRTVASTATAGVDLTRRVLAAEAATIVGSLVTRTVVAPFSAPHTRFNTKLGPHRAVAATTIDRARVGAIQRAAGVTGNDVVTTVIAGVVREWLAARGELPDRSLVAICPVSVRGHESASADPGTHGNQFGLGLCPLGTDLADPAGRLALVHAAMAGVKGQVGSRGPGAMLVVLAPAIGPTVLLPLLPLGSAVPPSYNMPISNVPGPREQLYFNGARVDEIYPVSVVYDGMALNVTVCSYAGRIGVGYVADRDVVADVETLAAGTERSLAELEQAVGVGPSESVSTP